MTHCLMLRTKDIFAFQKQAAIIIITVESTAERC